MSSGENKLSELQNRIEQTKHELEQIKQHEKPMPEFINTTNVLRSNEYLLKEIQTQAKLVSVYENYSQELEKMVLSTSVIKLKIKHLKSHINTRKKSSKKIRRKPRKTRKVKRKKLKRRR